jgi:hypothetical protein
MPAGFVLTIIGEKRLAAKYHKAPADVQKEIDHKLLEVGQIVQREARRNAPFKEGDLENSIQFERGGSWVDVFVPINSRAGKYGKWIHDGRYNRGPGTRAKGSRAGRKYIKRAIADNRVKIARRVQTVFDILQRN